MKKFPLFDFSVLKETPQNAPQWLWYYMGYILSLLLVFHDEGLRLVFFCNFATYLLKFLFMMCLVSYLRIRVPKVFMSLFKTPPTSKEDEGICPIGVEDCANLSGM